MRALGALVRDWERGRLVREGVSLAIVGPPNAGKSSLLNALLGEERAIVSEIAGTTRDVIEETFAIDGVPVRVLDTAGLRASDDAIERMGMDRTRRALDAAAVALVVVDGSRPLDADARAVLAQTRGRDRVVLFNKRDLGTAGYDARDDAERDAISGRLRTGAAAVRWALRRRLWCTPKTARRARRSKPSAGRSRVPAGTVKASTWRGHISHRRVKRTQWRGPAKHSPTLARRSEQRSRSISIAPELLAAVAALGEITGAAATEAVLDGVFARFCIGK